MLAGVLVLQNLHATFSLCKVSCLEENVYLHQYTNPPPTHTLCVASKVKGGEGHASNRQLFRGWGKEKSNEQI